MLQHIYGKGGGDEPPSENMAPAGPGVVTEKLRTKARQTRKGL